MKQLRLCNVHWASVQSFVVMFLSFFSAALAFNFDIQTPAIVSSGVADGEAIAFGFSLAQHELSNGSMRALVGAPKANSDTYVREGGAFSCPFVNGGTCQFESIFQSREDANPDLFKFPLSSNNLSNTEQLLGFSLRSFTSGRVVACAPLYVPSIMTTNVDSVQYTSGIPRGRCVILLNQDLLPTDSSGSTQVLQLSTADIDGDGLSLAGVDTGSLNVSDVEYLALGSTMSGASPIPAGLVHLTELSPTGIGRAGMTLSSPSLNAPALPLTGYHIETGYFTVNSGTQQIATSAPRGGNHMGQIQIMTVGSQLNPVYTISGSEVDGYFGYDFAVLDINSQGYHSLVVGCPLCVQERGRIYIYSNTGVPSAPFNSTSIESPSTMRGRFGLAVENIGDIDGDGYSDIAVSAPYAGSGVVYIFRGAGDHLVITDYQEVPAVPSSTAFGYSISGGLDVDSNGYADMTISDLSGNHVITFRSSPVVTVIMEFKELKTQLDIVGDTDRLCPLTVDGDINLICFNVTPCVYHESNEVNEFAVSYSVIIDRLKKRVGLYQPPSATGGQAELTANEVSGEITITGSGRANRTCSNTYTFALNADFTEPAPVTVEISIGDAAEPLSLTSDPEMEQLGGALHPVLRRYIAGDEPQPLSLLKEVSFNVNCSGGSHPDICEPNYQINLLKEFSNDVIPLASTNEFGFQVDITNSAADDGLNPTLFIVLPKGVLLNRFVSISQNTPIFCNTRAAEDLTTSVECSLPNPALAGNTFTLEVYFLLNDSDISLDTQQLELEFSVVDGASQVVVATQRQSIGLEAIAGLTLSSLVEESYQAFRSTVFVQNVSRIPLNETGPLINFRSVVQNTRHTNNGTTIPRSQLRIHLPVEIVREGKRRPLPLIVPTEILTGLGSVNCSHYQAVPVGLSSYQEPTSFLPVWTGPPPPSSDRCEKNGLYRCGVIICTITDLKPAPSPAVQITMFARLYSPSVMSNGDLTVVSELMSETELPRIAEPPESVTTSEVSFQVFPAITDVPRECLPYWVVVVPVVIGIFALTVIIAILGCCGLFKRWKNWKSVKESDDYEETDNGFAYHRRAVPPIPGLDQDSRQGNGSLREEGPVAVGGALDKEKEAEAEAEMELEMITRAVADDEPDSVHAAGLTPPTKEQPPKPYDFDPSLGVDAGEGIETDL